MTKKEIHVYTITGTLVRPEDNWCRVCMKPAIWEGPIWTLTPSGVSPWGHIRGCHECDKWIRTPIKK